MAIFQGNLFESQYNQNCKNTNDINNKIPIFLMVFLLTPLYAKSLKNLYGFWIAFSLHLLKFSY